MKILGCRCLGLLAIVLIAFASAAHAETAATAATPNAATAQKAMVEALDRQLARFEALLARDENAAHATTVRATFDALKQRRDAFSRVAVDQAKYDELRFDLNVAYQRLNLWLAPPIAPKNAAKPMAADPLTHNSSEK